MMSRYSIFAGAILLIFVQCATAGAPHYSMIAVGGSSFQLNPGQENRELGRPLYRTFTHEVEGAPNRIISAFQDPRGPMIFGSINCVLEYDGQRWTSYPVPNGGAILGLMSDQSGTIWLGGTEEIGTLTFDSGTYRYKSYAQLLPESERHFGEVMSIASHGADIYFICERKLLHWDGKRFSVILLPYEPGSFWSFSSFSGRLFVHAKNNPFSEIVGDHLVPFLDDPVLRETTVIGAIELSKEKTLLVTREKGIFELQGSRIVPFKTDADNLFTNESYVDLATTISKDLFVIGVQRRGLVFLDASGRIQETFLEENGLPIGVLYDLRLDRSGGLWVVGDTSLARINPNRSISVFDHENGLPKSYTASTVRFGGFLYAATGDGLYRLEPGNGLEVAAQFRKVPGVTDFIYCVKVVPGQGLLISGDRGVYFFDGNRFQTISSAPLNFAIARSAKVPGRFFVGGGSGLRVIRLVDGHWIDEGGMPGFDRDVISIAETAEGDLLLGTLGEGFFLVKLHQNSDTPLDGAVPESLSGVPTASKHESSRLVEWRNQVLLGSNKGIFAFRESDKSFYQPDFIPSQIIGREIRWLETDSLDSLHLWLQTVTGEPGSVQAQEIGHLNSDGTFHALHRSISSSLGGVKSVYEESASKGPTLWIAGERGLVRVDPGKLSQARSGLRLYLSEATSVSGEPLTMPQPGRTLELPFENRDIRLRFATDDFDDPEEVRYRTKFDGLNSGWTPYFRESTWQSGSLNEGRYCLHVTARNGDGEESSEFSLAITIFPPWYRAPWMYLVYGTAAALALFALISWRLWQMRVRERALISMVDFKTRELRQSEECLREAKDNAEAANRAKTAFLANMSHEVRTPLNSILGYAQLLLRGNRSAKDTASKLKSIIDSGEHLLGMMNELLDLARVESGKLVVNLQAVDIASFLQTLVAEFEIRARQCGLQFKFECDESVRQCIETDPVRLRQILYNLIGNAFKFTNAGSVSLKAAIFGPNLRFQVSDTGKGIAPADLPYLFKPFYQAANRDQNTEGVGLGLYITERITKLLGGQIDVSTTLGQGSTFWVDLPVKSVALPAQCSVNGKVIGYEGPTRRVLVVDDDRSNRDVIRQFLVEVGFVVDEADSADIALKKMRSGQFDGAISDIRMTGKDGNALCREVRSDETLKKTVMIASSASVYEGNRHDAMAAGFDDFLAKPVREKELFQLLEQHMNLHWTIVNDSDRNGSFAMLTTGGNGSGLSHTDEKPPLEDLLTLLKLAGEGDVVGLRRELERLSARDSYLKYVQRLAQLVAAYRIDDVESILQEAIGQPIGSSENEHSTGRR